jgi:hypothetical protein
MSQSLAVTLGSHDKQGEQIEPLMSGSKPGYLSYCVKNIVLSKSFWFYFQGITVLNHLPGFPYNVAS